MILILIHGAGSCEHVRVPLYILHQCECEMRSEQEKEASPLRVFARRGGVGYSVVQPWTRDPLHLHPKESYLAQATNKWAEAVCFAREVPARASLVKQARLPTRGAQCGLNRKLIFVF